jgi:hypothetical protein
MLINFLEWKILAEKIGETKQIILESCLTPKNWAELLAITNKVSSTLSVHVADLIKTDLLDKDKNHFYSTTQKGIEILKLVPYVRSSPEGKTPPELINMVHIGLRPTTFTLKEKLILELGGLIGVKHEKSLKRIYEDSVKAIEQAITLWLPKGLEPDKTMYKEVNRLIGLHTKKNPKLMNDKLTILIEFDLPKALDNVIRDEDNEEIKNRLIENRDKILMKLHKHWHRLTK